MKDGILIRRNILGSRITIDNLLGQLRLKGAYNFSYKPASLPIILVYDGKAYEKNLQKADLSKGMLANKIMLENL